MLKYQFSLLAIATILLSSTLVSAREISEDNSLSVGNIWIQTSDESGVNIHTPQLQNHTIQPASGRAVTSRYERYYRSPVIRHGRVMYRTTTVQPRVVGKVDRIEYTDFIRNSTIHTSTSDSHTSSEQHVQCHGTGSSVSQSSQTINGRTVSSEVHTTCN